MCNKNSLSPTRHRPRLFQSFYQRSFPSSCAVNAKAKRTDLVITSGHDILVDKDYALLAEHQRLTVRDGVRWYLIESRAGIYCQDSFLAQLRAAEKYGIEVIWELAHFGWPDGLDIWQPEFVGRFAQFARAFACILRSEGHSHPFISPVNQIALWSWAAGRDRPI